MTWKVLKSHRKWCLLLCGCPSLTGDWGFWTETGSEELELGCLPPPSLGLQCPCLHHPAHPGLHSAGRVHLGLRPVGCTPPGVETQISILSCSILLYNKQKVWCVSTDKHTALCFTSYFDHQVARGVSGHSGEFICQLFECWADILINHPTCRLKTRAKVRHSALWSC